MMEHYVTLFDSLFLPQGLALHLSMERHLTDYTLWVLCMDDTAYEVLLQLRLANVRLLSLSQLETAALKQLKPTRSLGEYCWTLTPFSLRFVFEADAAVMRVTYLDADTWFRKNPAAIFREFDAAGKEVLITDHAYAPDYDQTAHSGQYCVQFMTFTRQGGEVVRDWWEQRCVEWCYARAEAGKFGDQKYLDDWPERFADQVHVLANQAVMLAPWNARRFPYSSAIVWHFHGLRLFPALGRIKATPGPYELPKVTQTQVYLPYLADIQAALRHLALTPFRFRRQVSQRDAQLLTAASGLFGLQFYLFSALRYPLLRYPLFDLGRL